MISIQCSGCWWIVILISVFSAWFIYQDVVSLSVNQAELMLFLLLMIIIRVVGWITGLFPIDEMNIFFLWFGLINAIIAFLCVNQWMGWGDLMVIAGMLMTLQTEDMIELIMFGFTFSTGILLVLFIFGLLRWKKPLPFLPFLTMGYYLSILLKWHFY